MQFKVLLVGEAGVGKSTLLQRHHQGSFDQVKPTIGLGFSAKSTRQMRLLFWDAAGDARFRCPVQSFARGAHAALLLFDLSNRTSFAKLQPSVWQELQVYGEPDMRLVLVGCKADLPRQVSRQEAADVALMHNMLYYETSAKTGRGVSALFEALADSLLPDLELQTLREPLLNPVRFSGCC